MTYVVHNHLLVLVNFYPENLITDLSWEKKIKLKIIIYTQLLNKILNNIELLFQSIYSLLKLATTAYLHLQPLSPDLSGHQKLLFATRHFSMILGISK